MSDDKKPKWTMEISLPRTSASDLMGRQSVRATFRLTEQCIDAISILSKHLGIKQKSLFDHLIEDTRSLRMIANEAPFSGIMKRTRIQKTFVMSRKTLLSLEEISNAFNAPRDALVEISVQRLLPIIAGEGKKHQQRKASFGRIQNHFKTGLALLEETRQRLGADDPLSAMLQGALAAYENAYQHMEAFMDRGKLLEEFEPEFMEHLFSGSTE